MIKVKAFLSCVIVAFIFTSCTFYSKKELDTSFLLKASTDEYILSLSGYSKDEKFIEALKVANEMLPGSSEGFITLFGRAYNDLDPDASLATIFSTVRLRDRISFNSTNEEVISVLKGELDDAIDNSIIILRSRINRYGIRHQNVKRIDNTDNILIELPAIDNIDRVKKLIEARAKLEFWETYEYSEIYSYINDANEVLRGIDIWKIAEQLKSAEQDMPPLDRETIQNMQQASEIDLDSTGEELTSEDDKAFKEFAKQYPIFAFLKPAFISDEAGKMRTMQGPVVGYASIQDTALVNYLFNSDLVKEVLPGDLRLYWSFKPHPQEKNKLQLIAIKVTSRDGSAPLDDWVVEDAEADYSQSDNVDIHLTMNESATKIWSRMTANNVGRSIAIVLDGLVCSYPRIQSEIKEGNSLITGQFTPEEAQRLVSIISPGLLPIPLKIVEENIKRE